MQNDRPSEHDSETGSQHQAALTLRQLAHDLRGPLSTIVHASALGKKATDLESAKPMLEMIELQAKEMVALLNDLPDRTQAPDSSAGLSDSGPNHDAT